MSKRLKSYVARLDELINRTRKFEAIPIFVTQPSKKYKFVSNKLLGDDTVLEYDNRKYNGVDYYNMMRVLDDVTIQTCKKYHAICIDLASDLALILEDDDFYDFAHMSPKGARKAGLYLYQELKGRI